MIEDTLYRKKGAVEEDFCFNEHVAEVFDDMLQRSIPYYRTVIEGMASLFACRLPSRATIYDLGCSTGTTLLDLARRLDTQKFHFIGIDKAPAMLDKARQKSSMHGKEHVVEFREDDIINCLLPGATAIICNYTLQFLRPIMRQNFVCRLYDALPPGGIFILSEKTIAHSGRLNRDFIDIYHTFKRNQGYSELEIAVKREALENVLVPFSPQENMSLLETAGFAEIEIFFKWFNFMSFVALKG